jgi:hypothetical protein
METKLIAMILGVALVLATATVYTQSVFAHKSAGGGFAKTDGGQTAHGPATAYSHTSVAQHNPNCGGTGPRGDNGDNV